MSQADAPMTFIVRVTGFEGGVARGVIERVRTGEKRPFRGIATIGTVISAMVGETAPARRLSPRPGE